MSMIICMVLLKAREAINRFALECPVRGRTQCFFLTCMDGEQKNCCLRLINMTQGLSEIWGVRYDNFDDFLQYISSTPL
jgi:hypothetical protein